MHHSESDSTLRFLQRFQQLLQDSRYTTTYKFALLKAVCDATIELPEGEDEIPINALADRLISIYWTQARPYRGFDLNHGGSMRAPAKAIELAAEWRTQCKNQFAKLQSHEHITEARSDMRSVLLRNPLWRLQNGAGESFLYAIDEANDRIRVTPAARIAIRSLHALLSDMIESHWTRWIQRRNPRIASEVSLRDHLFGIERPQLRKVIPRLLELQENRSFYSAERLDESVVHVDHFIPWSVSRHNAVGNLVLCTAQENIRFSDSLKPLSVRQRWSHRNTERSSELKEIARETGLRWDPEATTAIADWAYRIAL
jgi:hypothetical protein